MTVIRKFIMSAIMATAAMSAAARPSVLSLADHANDSTIIYPESVETDVHK